MIEESETLNVKSAESTFEEYSEIFKGMEIALIHGRMKNKDKQEVMEKLQKRKPEYTGIYYCNRSRGECA